MKRRIALILIFLVVSLPFVFAYDLTYDDNGNLVTGDDYYRIYDSFNHLVQVKEGNTASGGILEEYGWHPTEERILVKHVYDGLGNWNETVYYISDSFVQVKNSSGTYDYKYVYQNGQLIAQENPDGSKYFFHNDHLGSVSLVTNENGNKVEETFYLPYGEIAGGGTVSRFDYEGKEFDSVVGDYDFNARKMNPEWGKFTQPDTLLPDVYDPQQLNRYAFERNNPYKYVDPDGEASIFPIIERFI